MDPISALSFLGAVCSIASFLQQNNLDITLGDIQKAATETLSDDQLSDAKITEDEILEILNSAGGQEFIAFLFIDPDLLKHLADDANQSKREYIDCLKAAGPNLVARSACDTVASRKICDTLNRIMDRNGGKLPDFENVPNLWESFNCVRIG